MNLQFCKISIFSFVIFIDEQSFVRRQTVSISKYIFIIIIFIIIIIYYYYILYYYLLLLYIIYYILLLLFITIIIFIIIIFINIFIISNLLYNILFAWCEKIQLYIKSWSLNLNHP